MYYEGITSLSPSDFRYARDLGYSGTGRRQETAAPARTQLIALSVPSVQTDYVKEIVAGAVEALHHREAEPGG